MSAEGTIDRSRLELAVARGFCIVRWRTDG
jgi:hypothetical protein